MKDNFAALEDRSKVGTIIGILSIAGIIAVMYAMFWWPAKVPRSVAGTVQSAGVVSVARVSGATREAASIRLEDGTVVTAQVASGGPLAPGDRVRLLEQPRLLVGPAYQVVSKVSGQ